MYKQPQIHGLKSNTIFMIKKYFYIVLLFCFSFSFSQTDIKQLKTDLELVTDIKSAKQFIKDNPKLKAKVYTYNEEKHNNSLSKKLFSKNVGASFETEEQSANTLYKIISITPTLHYRASYIFLDGKKLTISQINSLHTVIMSKLNSGKQFNHLAGKYSMDRNARKGGDLGWFTSNKASEEFINSLKENNANTIFNLDLPETKKHYIINKTHQQKNIRLLQVLKITFEKDKNKRLINVFN
ncbi:MAG: hypothetical protein COA88_07725 [Kordia sp.]|nr:MAG: hypothetical protein COA88_07725 [Kordia sp.]